MITTPETNREHLYKERKKTFDTQKLVLQRSFNFISLLRILFFVTGLIVIVYFANEGRLGPFLALIFIFPVIFGFFIRYHNKKKYQLNQAIFMAKVNEDEVERLNLNLKNFDQGEEFLNANHPYSSDLNLFGRHSLFQLVNRTTTTNGKMALAKTFNTPLNTIEQITERQEGIKELAEKIDWMQDFQASGMHERTSKNTQKFVVDWIHSPINLKNKWVLKALSFILPLAFLLCLVGFFTFGFPGYFMFLCLVVNGLVLSSISKVMASTIEQSEESASILKTYSALLSAIEKENFSSLLLRSLKGKITDSRVTASKEIKLLSSIVSNLETRKNPYFFITINLITLWELHWLLKLDQWKANVQHDISNWLDVVTEFEVLNSLAGFSFSHPEMTFPKIVNRDFMIQGTSLAHPLIARDKRIGNDVELIGLGKTHVITGSNMSGKSTYMRTVGINAVLALTGAPVLASSFSISPMQVFTCMHIHDSLEEETSSFYAELKRIKQLIVKLEGSSPVFYLLDELLKGTNSVDRNLGAQALVKQLHQKTASGLISTHDLELGKLEEDLKGSVKNYSFNSSIINDEIIFDYKLKEGICHSFNASKLMEKMGIRLKDQMFTEHREQ